MGGATLANTLHEETDTHPKQNQPSYEFSTPRATPSTRV